MLALCVALLAAAISAWWLGGAPEGDGAAARAPTAQGGATSSDDTTRAGPAALEAPSVGERVARDTAAKRSLAVFLVGEVRGSDGEREQVDLVLVRASNSAVSAPGDAARNPSSDAQVRDITRERTPMRNYFNGRVVRSGRDGAFRIEVTEHVAAALAAGAAELELWVKVLRTGESPREFAIVLRLEREWLEASAPIERRADLVLRRSGRVIGRVLSREPLEGDAWVALFELNGGTVRRQPLAQTRCDGASGAFELLAEVDREVALVAWSSGRRPRTERLLVSDRAAPLELLLDGGERLAGLVRLGPDPVACELDLALIADGGVQCVAGEDALTWNGAAFEWSTSSGHSDGSGHFEVTALAPARYRVDVKAPRGVRASATTLEVQAPADDALLELPLGRVELRLYRDGAPAANFRFSVTEQRQRGIVLDHLLADAAGSAMLWLAEDSEVWVNYPAKSHADLPNGVRIDNPGPGRSTTQRIDW